MSRPEQSDQEVQIFRCFVGKCNLQVSLETIENRPPPAPDIKCYVEGNGYVAFELKEICDEQLAKYISLCKQESSGKCQYKRLRSVKTSSDDLARWIEEKFYPEEYVSDCPMELLFFTNGRTGLTDDVILCVIKKLETKLKPLFQKVWFMGKEICGCIVPDMLKGKVKYTFHAYQEGQPTFMPPYEECDDYEDAVKRGEAFVKAHPDRFPPEYGEVKVDCSCKIVG